MSHRPFVFHQCNFFSPSPCLCLSSPEQIVLQKDRAKKRSDVFPIEMRSLANKKQLTIIMKRNKKLLCLSLLLCGHLQMTNKLFQFSKLPVYLLITYTNLTHLKEANFFNRCLFQFCQSFPDKKGKSWPKLSSKVLDFASLCLNQLIVHSLGLKLQLKLTKLPNCLFLRLPTDSSPATRATVSLAASLSWIILF